MRIILPTAALMMLTASALSAEKPANVLPPPEETEYWTPVPPVVTATAGSIPSDAIVLFDGKNLDNWAPASQERQEFHLKDGHPWKIEDGAMVVVPTPSPGRPCDQATQQSFGDVQLHLEFRTPAEAKGTSQDRGNSGVFFMGLYELQVLDSYNNPTYVNGQAGSVYKQHPPLVNASRPPGEWQTYDAVFVAPRFAADGKLVSPARLTAFHNGVLVQNDVVLKGPTVYRGQPAYKAHAEKLPLLLQDHRHPVAYRNIWVRELQLPAAQP
jgi:Domain of Unknown Function (DUF1080)